MSVTYEDLAQASLETADCEKQNNFSTTEIQRIVNEAALAVYDFIISTWQSYFAKSVQFTLPPSNAISIPAIVTGIPDVPTYPVIAPTPGPQVVFAPSNFFSLTLSATNALQFLSSGGSTSVPVPPQTFIPPAGRVLQVQVTPEGGNAGQLTAVTLYRSGIPVATVFNVANGAPSGVPVVENEISFDGPIHFDGEQSLDIGFQQIGSPATFNVIASTLFQLDQPSGDFYKEAGVSFQQGNLWTPVDPLRGYRDRNSCRERHYWLQGNQFSMWPQPLSHAGIYLLDYAPDLPLLSIGGALPSEMERWREMVEIQAAIKFKTKRSQDTTDLERRLLKLENAVTIAATQRKSEPRKVRIDRSHDQFPMGRGWGWRNWNQQ